GYGQMLLYAVLVVSWGLNYLVVRWGLEVAAPLWLAFLRAGVGAAAVLGFLSLTGRVAVLRGTGRRDALLLGIPTTGLFFGLWFLAAESVPPGQAAVLVYTFPLWVVLLSAFLNHHLPRGPELLAIGVGFGGVIMVSQPWLAGAGALPAVAVLELLGGALAWAVGTVLFKKRFRGPEVAEANLYQLLGGSATLLGLSVLIEPNALPRFSPDLLVEVLWLGLAGTALAYGIWYHLLDRYRAETLSAYTFLVPLAALALSIPVLGESIDPVQGVGVILVLASIYVTGRYSRMPAAHVAEGGSRSLAPER
ncbi:MAG: DMT family transporter, partial [Thermoplasmata archaeon]